ncbi:MAG: 4-oxalocrotonate tautomerase [Burkholderiales bacterium RIFCSPLOWO2_02_FULL_57_36]|nr:MAG: 4-oxalocrotonate tautomerase [Burkholderiales bacterium RIFCSPLOWO2_02_FULL_57_36]
MPYLNIKLSAAPSVETSRLVAAALTEITAEILRKKRELTAVTVEYIDPASWFIGGTPVAETERQSVYLDIKITRGTNTKDEKEEYVARAFAVLEKIFGTLHSASYVVIHEVDAEDWGYQGRTQAFRFVSGKLL